MPSKITAAERVTREDLVMFINACFACSGQREFYGDSYGQSVSIGFLHEYILGNYRRLYARTLAAGINHFNQAQIIINLLSTGRDTHPSQRAEENALITTALRRLPPQRALRALTTLRERRVNNRRARAVIRDYLAGRPDPAFDAVKYRSKVRRLAAHAHLDLGEERSRFLFDDWKRSRFETPLFEAVRQAYYSAHAVYDLPYSIAEGFAAHHKIPRDRFLAGISEKMTTGEKLRLQKAASKQKKVDLKMDLGRVALTRLAIYILSLGNEERRAHRAMLDAAMEHSARRLLRRAPRRLGRVAAVLDRSYSSSGSSEKRRRPLAVALAASRLLRLASSEYRAFWTPDVDDEMLVFARGQSDLATPLIDALEWGADLVIIVSDGFENSPPRGAAEVARVFRERLDPKRRTSIVHMNPVFDAEDYAPRAIGPHLPTVGLRDAEDLLTMLGFARFAEGSAPLSELESYLEGCVREMLSDPPAWQQKKLQKEAAAL